MVLPAVADLTKDVFGRTEGSISDTGILSPSSLARASAEDVDEVEGEGVDLAEVKAGG